MKNRAKSVSARTLALVLCFVMLLTAIGSGSVLSAVAAGFDKGDASVFADAVKAGADVKADAEAREESSDEPLVDDIEDGLTLSKKSADTDLADTGRGADVAATGLSSHKVYFVVPYAWNDSNYTIKIKGQIGNNWDTGLQTATDTGETYFGYRIYYCNLDEQYGGWDNIWIYGYEGSTEKVYLCLNSSWEANTYDNKCNFKAISNNDKDWADYKPDTDFYLSGYLGKFGQSSADTDFQSNDYKMTRGTGANSTKWSYSYRANGDQYFTVNMKNDYDARVLHPTSDNAVSGTKAGGPDQNTGGWKWKATANDGDTVSVTYDTATRKLTWTVTPTETSFYLRGWLNGANYTQDDLPFTKVNDNKYTLSWSPSSDHEGFQYATIWDGSTSYHPANQNDSNGAAGSEKKSDPSGEYKWKVGAVNGQTVNFTWERASSSSDWALSWTVSGGSSSSGSWKYTGDHTDATPEKSGSSSYYFVWANNDNGPGTAGTTAIAAKNSGNEYWADLTSYAKSNSNFYFALSDNSSNSGIRGNKYEQINGTTKAAGNTVTMTNGSGQTIFYVEMKEKSSVTGNAYFQLVRGVDWTKVSAIGVSATYSGSGSVNYKYYYKEVGSGEEVSEVTLYAKDGAIVIDWDNKGSSGVSDTSGTAYGFSSIADTTFTKIGDTTVSSITANTEWKDGASVDDDGASYETAKIAAGKTIKLKTTIDSTRRSKYYVKGWSINGTTYKCDGTAGVNAASDTDSSTGVCEMTYTIPTKLTTDKLEITPIYYLRTNTNCVTFYIEGFNTLQDSWGTTPYIYPFYGNENNVDNSFGVYPGQPMVYANGQYSVEIPMTNTKIVKADGSVNIKGITINNGYADHVHRNLVYMWSDHDNDADHKQTYDYDDFAKIYYECIKNGEHPNSIIFRIQDESKVFNRAQYGGGKSGQFADGTDNITLSDIENNGNGWELLTNYYGEAVNLFGDHSAVSSITPSSYSADNSNAVYVVSTGYNANIAGDYGTMWKVYDKDGKLISNSGGRVGIPPSLLLLNGTASTVSPLGTYLDASRSVDGVGSYTDKHSDYYGVYKALKASYASKIVYITYEQNTQDTRKVNTGTGADRVDGRWFYTHEDDKVQSKIEIECYDKSTGAWVKQNTTESTGADSHGNTAVFNSGSYKSATELTTSTEVLNDNTSTWYFTATAGTGYMFDSWQLKYSDTSYDKMDGTGAAGSIPATANYTLVARFMPVVTGQLTITHALSNSSTGEGTVDMTVTQGGTSQTVTVTNGVARTNLTVSNSNASQVITVILTATPLYDGKVNSFGYDRQLTLSPAATEENLNTKATAATSTFSFTVGQLYAGTTQTITDLAYTSLIEPTPHYYKFTYSFNDRGDAPKSYTAKGEISLKDYKNNVSGSHVLSDAFIKSMAPFESNFLKKLTLGSITKSYDNDTFTASASYTSADSIPTYNVTFKLPYEYYTSSSGSSYKKYNATSAGTYNASKPTFDLLAKYNEFVTISATDTATGSQTNVGKVTDSNDPNHTGNDFITAPDQLTSGSTTYYFKYWEIRKKTDSDQANAPLVSRIYYPDFHYRIFGDYYVEAIYSTTKSDSWHNHYSEDQGYNCSIIYLGDSRNQWNDGDGPTSTGDATTQAAVAADKIYNDFIFSYNDNGKPLTGASNDLGMIIERVASDGKWATGDANVSDMSTYQDTYGVAGQKDDIATWLGSGGSAPTGVLPKIAWNTSQLNNKNYTEQNYSFYSAYGQKVEDHSITFNTDSTVDNFVYRAYAYMKGSNGTYYVSDPVYFCMRYTANLNYTE